MESPWPPRPEDRYNRERLPPPRQKRPSVWNVTNRERRIAKTFGLVWCFLLLAALAFWAVVAYVAYHFISKVW